METHESSLLQTLAYGNMAIQGFWLVMVNKHSWNRLLIIQKK